MLIDTSVFAVCRKYFKLLCSFFLIKVQEEQASPSKGSKQKVKEKPEQVRETPKEKRRSNYSTKKGLSGGPSGTIAPMSDIDQSFDGEHSQEKFTR